MNYTTNLHLKKPEYGEASDVADLNDNFDDLDDALAALLPEVTTADNGKFLVVVEGVWAATAISQASGGTY